MKWYGSTFDMKSDDTGLGWVTLHVAMDTEGLFDSAPVWPVLTDWAKPDV
jgi:hypothetical protein